MSDDSFEVKREDGTLVLRIRRDGNVDFGADCAPSVAARQFWDLVSRSMPLTLEAIRAANVARLPHFRDAAGALCHKEEDGSDWSIADWYLALTGEVGELANLLKKVRRGDIPFGEAKPMIAKELADILLYLDLNAYRLEVELGPAVRQKFNEVSERVKSPIRL